MDVSISFGSAFGSTAPIVSPSPPTVPNATASSAQPPVIDDRPPTATPSANAAVEYAPSPAPGLISAALGRLPPNIRFAPSHPSHQVQGTDPVDTSA